MIRKQGPLRAYSTRSMERSIGVFSKLIKSKKDGGKNASNLIERLGMFNHINLVLPIREAANIINTRSYSSKSYINHPQDPSGPQLWEPFIETNLDNEISVESINGEKIIKALKRYYLRSNTDTRSLNPSQLKITLSSRLLLNSTVFSSSIFRNYKKETSRGNHHIMFSCSNSRYSINNIQTNKVYTNRLTCFFL